MTMKHRTRGWLLLQWALWAHCWHSGSACTAQRPPPRRWQRCRRRRGWRRRRGRGCRARRAAGTAARAVRARQLHRAGGERRRGRQCRRPRRRHGHRRPVGDPRGYGAARQRASWRRCARRACRGLTDLRGRESERELRAAGHSPRDLLPERGRRPGAASRRHHRNRGDGGGGRLGTVESAWTGPERARAHRQPRSSRSTT